MAASTTQATHAQTETGGSSRANIRRARVLRALLSAVNNDHVSQGFHLMHLGATVGEDSAPALRGWLRQRFSSSLYTLTRTGSPEPPEGSLSNPYLDLSII